jgi:hypothetical protein
MDYLYYVSKEQYEQLGIETFAKGMATVYLHQGNTPATS